MDENDDLDSSEAEEAVDLDWLSEGTHCYFSIGVPQKQDEDNKRNSGVKTIQDNEAIQLPIQQCSKVVATDITTISNDVCNTSESNLAQLSPVSSISKVDATHTHAKNRVPKYRLKNFNSLQSYALPRHVVIQNKDYGTGKNVKDIEDNVPATDKYFMIPQRIIRMHDFGIKQVIRVLVSRDFLKKHGKSSTIFTCPRCSVMSNDLESLDDHMVSIHDITNSNTLLPNASLKINTDGLREQKTATYDELCASFSCSLCKRSFGSTNEWQQHFYMHLTNRIKRIGATKSSKKINKSSEYISATPVIIANDSMKLTVSKLNNVSSNNVDINFSMKELATNGVLKAVTTKGKRGRKKRNNLEKIANKQRGMTCKLCSQFSYSKQAELKRHMLTEHGDQLHKCKHCEMAFPLGFELLRHIRLYHPDQPVKKNPPVPKKKIAKLKIRLNNNKKTRQSKLSSESENDCIITVCNDSTKNRKRLSRNKTVAIKTEAKKRKIISDSENEEDNKRNEKEMHVSVLAYKDAQQSFDKLEQDSVGGPAERLRSRQRKSSKPVKKQHNLHIEKNEKSNKNMQTHKRKGVAVRHQENLNNDERSSSLDHHDPDWQIVSASVKVKIEKPPKKLPIKIPIDEVKKLNTPQETSNEHKERKSGQLTVCDHCGCCYEKRKELIAHIVNEHHDKLLKCSSCPKSFALYKSLKVHLMACHSQEMFNCRRCDMKFVTLSRLQRHIRIDHLGRPIKVVKTKPYGCTFCGKMFQTKQILDGHTNQHHLNVRPYKCSKCGIDFAYINNFKMHERTCVKSLICELCGENFATKITLGEHQKTVHNIVLDTTIDVNKPEYVCDHCNKEFPTELSLKCHLARVGSAAQRSSVLCDICGKECKKAAGLTMHKAYCHPQEVNPSSQASNANEESNITSSADTLISKSQSTVTSNSTNSEPVTCADCGKICQTATSLRIHRTRMHSNAGVRRVARSVEHCEVDMCCPTCGQMCKGKVGLTAHLRSHAPAVPSEVKCEKCDRTFDNKLGLDMHRRHAHTDTRKYRQAMPCSCPICSKEFTREGPMKLHMAVVHGLSAAKKKPHPDKVFECNICGHQFRMKAYLQRHNRMHAGVKPYICAVCSKCFTSSTNLAGHMAALHKDVEYTYNPLVNMVCNVAANGDLAAIQQVNANIPRDNQNAPRKTPNTSRKSSGSRKNVQGTRESLNMVHETINISREEPGYSQDILNISREMQAIPRDMSGMVRDISGMSREMPTLMTREIPVMPRDIPGMSRDIQTMVSRDIPNMSREIPNMAREIIMPRENPNIPQYAIGTMPTNWNYAYMGEFYRL